MQLVTINKIFFIKVLSFGRFSKYIIDLNWKWLYYIIFFKLLNKFNTLKENRSDLIFIICSLAFVLYVSILFLIESSMILLK